MKMAFIVILYDQVYLHSLKFHPWLFSLSPAWVDVYGSSYGAFEPAALHVES